MDRQNWPRSLPETRSKCRRPCLMLQPFPASTNDAKLDIPMDTRLYNEDLAPTPPSRRTWTTYNYIALWFSMSMEITTYMLASSLIAGGMNWKQAVFTILLGNLIVLIPMILTPTPVQ